MPYSTSQVARRLGVHKRTLLSWLYAGRLSEPRRVSVGGQQVRDWREDDVERAMQFARKYYRKATVPGRGRKSKPTKKPSTEQTLIIEQDTRSIRSHPPFPGIAVEGEQPRPARNRAGMKKPPK